MAPRQSIKHMTAFCSLLILRTITISAQDALSTLIVAEKAFAQHSVTHTTKDAFLMYLADSSIVFNSKSMAVDGKTYWQKRKQDSNTLDWSPAYAATDASGSMGFTTGPWQYRYNHDSASALGAYMTVWEKDRNGAWKAKVDLGITDPKVTKKEMTRSPKKFLKGRIHTTDTSSFSNAERDFITEFHNARSAAYTAHLAKDAILQWSGHAFLETGAAIRYCPDYLLSPLTETPLSSSISRSGDLGYFYGTLESGTKKGNYLRIWQFDGKDWHILAEMLNIE